MHEKFKIVLSRVGGMEELPDFVTPLRKIGKILGNVIDFFGQCALAILPLLCYFVVIMSFPINHLIRILPQNLVTLLELESVEVVWYTPNTFFQWTEVLFFPLAVLLVTYLVSWRKDLRWKRRYGPENFEDFGKNNVLAAQKWAKRYKFDKKGL